MMKQFVVFFMLMSIQTLILTVKAQDVEVRVKGLRNTKGVIQLAVFTSQENYNNDIAFFNKTYSKANTENGELIVSISLKTGIFGIAVFDDEDANVRLNKNFLGIPTEGFGFSNYESKGIGSPDFKDFSFYAGKGKTIVIVKMRYLF
jgi:uncharacterized protein (DUF2141 family)